MKTSGSGWIPNVYLDLDVILANLDVPTLMDLYTLHSDVQRGANDPRQEVRGIMLDSFYHDQPASGQHGSVQRAIHQN